MSTEQIKHTAATFQDYGELWNFNLQKIEDIQNVIEKSIHDLENKYVDFESAYTEITRQLGILSSIYSGYNTVGGSESVMRLKAVLASYRKRYTRESLDFNLVYSLLMKIADMRDASFEYFPKLSHEENQILGNEDIRPLCDHVNRKYKWITFRRNRSWFITRFSNILIHTSKNFQIVSVEEPDLLNIGIGTKMFTVRDIFIKSLDQPDSPRYVILLNRLNRLSQNYAADEIGKRIYSDNDIVSPILRPFKTAHENTLSSGRIRLFGINHLLLK